MMPYVCFFWVLLVGGCFFSPSLEESGYTQCEADQDCWVGRTCLSGYCVPPPWNDENYGQRRLLVLENETSENPPATGGGSTPMADLIKMSS